MRCIGLPPSPPGARGWAGCCPLRTRYRTVLCLNGVFPQDALWRYVAHLPCMATDGAAWAMLHHGLVPDVVVGDLDSFPYPELLPACTELVYRPNQAYSDFEKALQLLQERDGFPLLVCGVGGKMLEHILYNMHLLVHISQHHTVHGYDDSDPEHPRWVLPLRGEYRGVAQAETRISFVPSPVMEAETEGLVWDLYQPYTQQSPQWSMFNRIRAGRFRVHITRGCALAMLDANHRVTLKRMGD